MDRDKIIATIEEYRKKLRWYYTIDLGDGIKTPGMYDHRPYLKYYGLPEDLSGKRVLDIGTSNRFFAFEFEKRVAEQVIGIDLSSPESFNFCKEVLGLKARYQQMNIYDLSPSKMGGLFDLVFCGSLLLHLDVIVGAMRKIRLMTKNTAIVALAYFRTNGEDFPIFYSPLQMQALRGQKGKAKKEEITFPLTWLGNRKAYERLFKYVGFKHTQVISTFLLKPTVKHNFKLGTGNGFPHIVM